MTVDPVRAQAPGSRLGSGRTLLAIAVGLGLASMATGEPVRLNQPRIPPLQDKEWTAVEQPLLAPIQAERGYVPNVYRTLARHPALFTAHSAFGRYLQRQSSVPPRDRELLIGRMAWLSRGEYVWAAHSWIAMDSGLKREEVERIAKGPEADGWSPFDSTVLRAADELYRDVFISDATWKALAARYDTHQLMDLVLTAGEYHMLAAAMHTFGGPVDRQRAGFPPMGEMRPVPRARGAIPVRLREPRIPPIAEATWSDEEKELLQPIKQQRGYLLNVYATMARHPELYRLWLAFARHILRENSLPAREREMLICRIAWLTSGEYEWSAHTRLGKEAGLTDAEVARLAEGPEAKGWSAADVTLLRAVDELYRDSFIGDATWEGLAGRFDTHQLLDLVLTVTSYEMLAMALNSFGTQLDKDMAGFAPAAGKR